MIFSLFCNYDWQTTLHGNSSLLNDVIDKQKLVKLIQDRYGKLGATVNLCGIPDEIKDFKKKNRKSDNYTYYQKFIVWKNKETTSREIKACKLRNEIGISKDQFKDLTKELIFKEFVQSTDKKGYYQTKI